MRANKDWGDLFAGFTLWAVFSAQAIAYSRLAHATPVAGLVTAMAGALLYSALGSSQRASIGPAGGIAAIVGWAVAGFEAENLVSAISALTLMTAAFLVLAGLARVSFLQRLFPKPVFVGYLAGIGVTILLGQARDLLSSGTLSLLIGLVAIAGVSALKYLAPRIPGPFMVLTAATVLSTWLGWQGLGVPVIGSALGSFGSVTLPTGLTLSEWEVLVGPALSLALLVYVDALANSEALAKVTDPELEPRHDYFALGAVNFAAGIFGGFVGGCSSSRSIVALRAGAQTRKAGLIAGALLLLTAFSEVRVIQPLPLAALAGVVFVAAIDLVDLEKLLGFRKNRTVDFRIAILTMLSVIFGGPMIGVAVGVLTALAEAMRRAMTPHRSVLALGRDPRFTGRVYVDMEPMSLPVAEGVLVYRFGSGLFFGNAEDFLADMKAIAASENPNLRSVVINADSLGLPDETARDALLKAQHILKSAKIQLVFGNVRGPLRAALGKEFQQIDEQQFIQDVEKIRRAT